MWISRPRNCDLGTLRNLPTHGCLAPNWRTVQQAEGRHRWLVLNRRTTMAISECLFTSRSEEWPTPGSFFAELDREFHFTLDPCATAENAKCRLFFSKDQDGLRQNWGRTRSSAIRPMAGRCAIGRESATRPRSTVPPSCFSRTRAPTRAGFMTGFTEGQSCALSAAAYALATASSLRRFRPWSRSSARCAGFDPWRLSLTARSARAGAAMVRCRVWTTAERRRRVW